MASKDQSKAHEVARQWMREHPEVTSNRTIARMLVKLRPKLFTNLENTRSMVRSIAGQMGAQKRKSTADKTQYKKAGIPSSKLDIPEGDSEFLAPLHIDGPRKVLIMGDLHIGYHDKRAIETAIEHGLKAGCNTLVLNGDIGDFYGASRFEKDPEARDLSQEIEILEQFLDAMKPLFKHRVYKCGNHDERWEKLLFRDAPAFGRVAKLRLDRILQLQERGYAWVQSKQWVQLGKLPLLHGHELEGGGGVNPARLAYLRVSDTIAVNHHHRTSQHTEPHGLSQKHIVTWSIGCLCNLRPKYKVVNKWNLGFATCEIDRDGSFEFSNYRIDQNEKYRVFR